MKKKRSSSSVGLGINGNELEYLMRVIGAVSEADTQGCLRLYIPTLPSGLHWEKEGSQLEWRQWGADIHRGLNVLEVSSWKFNLSTGSLERHIYKRNYWERSLTHCLWSCGLLGSSQACEAVTMGIWMPWGSLALWPYLWLTQVLNITFAKWLSPLKVIL